MISSRNFYFSIDSKGLLKKKFQNLIHTMIRDTRDSSSKPSLYIFYLNNSCDELLRKRLSIIRR